MVYNKVSIQALLWLYTSCSGSEGCTSSSGSDDCMVVMVAPVATGSDGRTSSSGSGGCTSHTDSDGRTSCRV